MTNDIDLRPWGYAPGFYLFNCVDCPASLPINEREMADKRAWRCKEHALAASADAGKYVGNEATVQIAEEAFRAGFRACVGRPLATMDDDPKAEDDAWSAFEPSEACKDLTR